MLSNAYFLAKFRFDAAEKELSAVQIFTIIIGDFDELVLNTVSVNLGTELKNHRYASPTQEAGKLPKMELEEAWRFAAFGRIRTRRVVASFWQFFAKIRSFSAVSAPIFASQYAFCSIFQNLPDYLAEIFEI